MPTCILGFFQDWEQDKDTLSHICIKYDTRDPSQYNKVRKRKHNSI